MPKKTQEFPEQINILAKRGTTEKLKAIAYYRGEAGRYAGPARDFITEGIRGWIESLPKRDRERFESILDTVKTTHNLLE